MATEHGPEERDRDRGAVLVLVAAAVATLAVLAALIVDLGGARRDRDADQVAADAMALAAAGNLRDATTSGEQACRAAWDYLTVNLPSAVGQPSPSCAPFASACDAEVPRRIETVVGQYTISFTHPVPDGHALLTGQPADPVDGEPCERFGVEITQERANLIERGTITINVDAVGRLMRGVGQVQAPLILLEQTGCEVLTLNGNGTLRVNTSDGSPGYINIDSDGSTCSSGKNLVLDTVGNSIIRAGAITMWALAGPHADKAFNPADTDLFDLQNPRISPTPIASTAPVGRSSIDWRYNCKPENGCPFDRPAHIDELRALMQPIAPNPNPPVGYTRWTERYGTHNNGECRIPPNGNVPAGNWYIDCPMNVGRTEGDTSAGILTIQGGNIVSDHTINVNGSNRRLRLNCAAPGGSPCPTNPSSPTIFYLRSGANLVKNGTMEFHETFVYLENGNVNLGGGAGLYWTAPNDPDHPFDDLTLWTERSGDLSFQGGSEMVYEGTLFAPNARITMAGNTPNEGIGAQLYARRLDIAGGANMVLAPRADRATLIGTGRALLIR